MRDNPIVSDGVVFTSSYDDTLYALNAVNGEILWKYGELTSGPVVAKEKVFFSTWDYYFYALDVKKGQEIWKYKMKPGMNPNVGPLIEK